MVVRIGCMYPDDWEFNNYEDGERIQIGSDVLSANFMILEDEDQDEALDGREGELPTNFYYELHDGQLCAIVDGKFVPCEDDLKFEYYLRRMNEPYKFCPYVGPKYGKAEMVLTRRLLVLGASHYGDDADVRDGKLTQCVIRDYLDPNCRVDRKNKNYTWKPTHTRFYKAIIGDRHVEIGAVVKSVVFYNYLQEFEGKSPEDKHPEKFLQKEIKEKNEKCFEKLLHEIEPEVIVVWGANVKNVFPWKLFSIEPRKACDKQFPAIYHCALKNRSSINVDICFSVHPSAPKFYKQEPRALFNALKLFDTCCEGDGTSQ